MPWCGLLALSSAIFIASTTEFLPGGLIPHIGRDLALSPATVGQLVTVFALTVVLAATPVALMTRRFPRKALILTGFVVICLGNIAVTASPSFEWLVGARIAGALGHALFWSVVSTFAADISPPEMLGRAMAITTAGGSLAGILGVPVGNALGQALGWRVSFLVVAGAGLLDAAILWKWLPTGRPALGRAESQRRHCWDSTAPSAAIVCLTILIVVIGFAGFGTYSAVWLTTVAGLTERDLPKYFLATGCAGAGGVFLVSRLLDRFPKGVFVASSVLVTALLSLFSLVASSGQGSLVFAVGMLLSAAFAGVPMALQVRMARSASPQMRGVAGAVQTTAFNIGIGGGAWMGGAVLTHVGVAGLPLLGIIAFPIGLTVILVWDVRMNHRGSRSPLGHTSGSDARATPGELVR
jgi:DHA1 family inner membrane transport protein